jgi:hypothetical protein
MMFMHVPAEFLGSMIQWFDSKEKATFIVAIMVLLFVLSLGWIAWRHKRFVHKLNAATATIQRTMSQAGWTPSDCLNDISKALENNTVASNSWAHYRGTLREDPRREGYFVNLINPSSWFSIGQLEGGGYEKWISTWASVFLCLGLFFTFVGLSAALMKVGNIDDAARLREAINGILAVSSAKFITSIFGILLFILWTLFGRWVASAQHRAVALFAAAVQKLTTQMTPEVLLMDQLLAAREQTDRMKTLADDVAVAFEARLTEVVGKRLDAFPAQMGESIRPVVEAIEGMGGSLGKGADAAMARVAERLEQAAETIRAAQGGIGSSGDEFGSSIARAAVTMTDTVTRMAATIDSRLAGLEVRIGNVNDALASGAQTITGVSQGLSTATSAALEQALTTIAEQAARGADQARQQSQAALEPLLQSMQLMAEQIRDRAAEGSGSLVEGSKLAANLLTTAAGGIGDRLGELESRIGRVDEAMTRGAQAITGMSAGMSEAASATLANALKAIADQAFRGAEQAREQSLAALQPVMQTLQAIAVELRERASEGSGLLVAGGKSAADLLTSAAGGIGNRMAGLESRIGNIDAALAKGAQSITGISDGLSKATSTALEQSLATISGEAARGAEQARQQSQAALEPLLQSLQAMAEQIREQASKGSGHLVDGGRSAAELLAAAAQSMSDQLTAATREASANLERAANSMATRMDAAVLQFQQLERAVAGNVGHLQRTGETINSAGTTFGTAATQLRLVAEPIQSTLTAVETSARQTADALKSATGMQDSIRNTTTTMQASISDAATKLADVSRMAGQAFEAHSQRFADTDDALGKTVVTLVSGVTGLSAEAARFVAEMQRQLAGALGTLGTGIAEIKDMIENIQTAAESLEGAMVTRARVGAGDD